MASRPKVLIDCDPGLDDAMAIMVAARHAEIVGVTTVSGNVGLDSTTRNAQFVLDLLGVDVPVFRGSSAPIASDPLDAAHVHGSSGLGPVEVPEPAAAAPDGAVDFILEASHAHDDLWIVAIGPWTNIALALQRDPSLARRIAGMSVMGGGLDGGNVTPSAEFNVYWDPEAADVVFRSGANLRMAGLNLTHHVLATRAMADSLRAEGHPPALLAADLLDFYLDAGHLAEAVVPLHDPCAVLAVTHPELFGWRELSVVVELVGTHTRGATVADRRPRAEPAGKDTPNVAVAEPGDTAAAVEAIRAAIASAPNRS